MKKCLIICILFLLVGCSKEVKPIHDFVDDENYIKLVELLEDSMFNDSIWNNLIVNDLYNEKLQAEKTVNSYDLFISKKYQKFSHTINSKTIEVTNTLTNEKTVFLENIEINSLEHFSTIILDTYKDEFSYYSMKHFIPLALELTQDETFDFYYENNYFSQNEYRLIGNVDKLNLDDNLHQTLLESSSIYQEIYDIDNPTISIMFKTDVNCKYFFSSFEFRINNDVIAKII